MKNKTTKAKKAIKVTKWVSAEDADKYPDAPIPPLGGFFGFNGNRFNGKPLGKLEGQRWENYISVFSGKSVPYLEAIRKEVIEKKIRYTGEDHQNADDGCPVLSDGSIAFLSWRAWGDLMAAIWSTEEDKDYCYMDFYMGR